MPCPKLPLALRHSNTPYPMGPPLSAHTLLTLSMTFFKHLCQAVLLPFPKGPSLSSRRITPVPVHPGTPVQLITQAAELQVIAGPHAPVPLYSAPSLPGPVGNKFTLIAAEMCLLF